MRFAESVIVLAALLVVAGLFLLFGAWALVGGGFGIGLYGVLGVEVDK